MNHVIYARQLAEVTRRLVEQGVRDTDPQLRSKFQNALQIVLGGSVAQRASQMNIDLPDLEQDVQADIVKDNVLALSALYFAAQLEDLKFFAVADKVADQFQIGVIPTTRSVGGEAIYRYIKDAVPAMHRDGAAQPLRPDASASRRARVDEPMPNREFGDLWIRFLSAGEHRSPREHGRHRAQGRRPSSRCFKNARDLAVNLSLHGYGIAHFAAVELQELVKNTIKMLSYPDVLSAFGVKDIWQLVERVSSAVPGRLGQRRARSAPWPRPARRSSSGSATAPAGAGVQLRRARWTSTTDLELIQDVERWLAVTGTDDDVGGSVLGAGVRVVAAHHPRAVAPGPDGRDCKNDADAGRISRPPCRTWRTSPPRRPQRPCEDEGEAPWSHVRAAEVAKRRLSLAARRLGTHDPVESLGGLHRSQLRSAARGSPLRQQRAACRARCRSSTRSRSSRRESLRLDLEPLGPQRLADGAAAGGQPRDAAAGAACITAGHALQLVRRAVRAVPRRAHSGQRALRRVVRRGLRRGRAATRRRSTTSWRRQAARRPAAQPPARGAAWPWLPARAEAHLHRPSRRAEPGQRSGCTCTTTGSCGCWSWSR